MTKINWNPQYGYSTYRSSNNTIQPAYPVDIVRMAYREPPVQSANIDRIADLEDRVKQLETLVLELQGRLTLTENEVTEIRTEGCWMLKK